MKIQPNGVSLKPLSREDAQAQRDTQLREAAKMFETHFLNQMVKSMRSTLDTGDDGLIKKNMGEKIFSEQLDGQYVDQWANKGGVGIADMIYNQIKDKYYDTTKRDFHTPHRMLPVAPKTSADGFKPIESLQMKMIPPSTGAKLEYRFEAPSNVTPGGEGPGGYQAQAPLDGSVLESMRLGEDWNLVKLDHGRGLTSEMTFPGARAPIRVGERVTAGQDLGQLDPARPVLAWKLDWV